MKEEFDCGAKEIIVSHNMDDPQNMLVLVIGFSGRSLDPVYSDQNMPAAVIYANGNTGFGCVNVRLKETSFNC